MHFILFSFTIASFDTFRTEVSFESLTRLDKAVIDLPVAGV